MFDIFKASFKSRPPEGTRVYAVGDIHGHKDRLVALHRLIVDDAARSSERRRVIVYVGDYYDRGPDSAGVVEMLIEHPLDGFDSVFLKGNHEEIVLRFLDGDLETGANWIAHGGNTMLQSYGVACDSAWPDYSDLVDYQQALSACFPPAHRTFLESLALSHVEGDHGYVIVHGHTPVKKVVNRFNRIDIDTGAGFGRALTAVVLAGTKRNFLQV